MDDTNAFLTLEEFSLKVEPEHRSIVLNGSMPEAFEGERNDKLFRYGCYLRQIQGATREQLLEILSRENVHCHPPLAMNEVQKIAKSVSRYKPGEQDTWAGNFQLEQGERDYRDTTELLKFTKEEIVMRWLVQNVVPAEGLTVLAGPDKAGKSCLALDLSIGVAETGVTLGRPVIGPCSRVLYLALEDNIRRVAFRVQSIVAAQGIDFESKDNLRVYFSGFKPRSPLTWLRKEIESFEPALVVIDTLALFKPKADVRANSYDTDYELAAALKQAAAGISVLVLTHFKKGADGSDSDSITGSKGLSAAADHIMLYGRDRKIRITGRDAEEPLYEVRGDWPWLSLVVPKLDSFLLQS